MCLSGSRGMCSRPFFSWFVEAWWALGAAERAQLAVTLEGLEFTLPLIRHAVAVAWASRCCPPGPFTTAPAWGEGTLPGFQEPVLEKIFLT